MRKYILAVLLMSLILGSSACGYQITEDTTVTVIRATPTPEPTATPEPTPTPAPVEEVQEPEEEAPVEMIQTESGVNVVVKEAVYVVNDDMNLRNDCSTEGTTVLTSVPNGTQVNSTGITEDGEWIAVSYNGFDGYIKAEYASIVE